MPPSGRRRRTLVDPIGKCADQVRAGRVLGEDELRDLVDDYLLETGALPQGIRVDLTPNPC